MTNPSLLPVAGFIGAVVFLFYRASYWQQRREGRSHAASLNDSTVLSVFLLGSAAFDYVAVVAGYS